MRVMYIQLPSFMAMPFHCISLSAGLLHLFVESAARREKENVVFSTHKASCRILLAQCSCSVQITFRTVGCNIRALRTVLCSTHPHRGT